MIRGILLGVAMWTTTIQAGEKEEVLSHRSARFAPNLVTSYDTPLMIVRGEKQYLYDEEGTQYLDAYNNVAHVGHCHPKVAAAAADQMQTLNTNTRYLHPLLPKLAEKLRSTLPEELDTFFFVNSGSEANDLAYRLARRFTGGAHCLMIENSYHGTTHTCVQLSGTKQKHHDADNHVHMVSVPDTYHGPYRDPTTAGGLYAQEVEELVAKLKADGKQVAAFFVEAIQGCGGNLPLPPEYLKKSFVAVRQAGGLCVADEVQIGFGRVGSHFWGFQMHEVVPDIVTLGKPMGNGFPVAAVATRKEIAEAFSDLEYFNTYGGSTLSCRVALTVLEVLQEEKLQEHAKEIGDFLLAGLAELSERHLSIGEVRGSGLYIGMELVRDRESRERDEELAHFVVQELKGRYHILTGSERNALRIKPPLCFSRENAEQLLSAIDEILTEREGNGNELEGERTDAPS